MYSSDAGIVIIKNNKFADFEFEKTRFDYCLEIFKRQLNTAQDMEKKSQLLLSFSVAILASFFLKFEYLKTIAIGLSENSLPFYFKALGWGSLLALGGSCLVALLCILQSVRLRSFKDGYPKSVIDSFFSPESEVVASGDKAHLLHMMAVYYVVAIDDNKTALQKKARYLKLAHLATVASLLALSIFLCTVVLLDITQYRGVTP